MADLRNNDKMADIIKIHWYKMTGVVNNNTKNSDYLQCWMLAIVYNVTHLIDMFLHT